MERVKSRIWLVITIVAALAGLARPDSQIGVAASPYAPRLSFECPVGGPTGHDLHLCLNSGALWTFKGMRRVTSGPAQPITWQVLAGRPAMQLKPALNLCLGQFDTLLVDESVPPGFKGQTVSASFSLDSGAVRSYAVPLRANGKMGEYGFSLSPLRILGRKLLRLSISPAGRPAGTGSGRIEIGDVRFTPARRPQACGNSPAYVCQVGGTTSRDLHFCAGNAAVWSLHGLRPAGTVGAQSATWEVIGNNPTMQLNARLNLCLGQFSAFLVDESVPAQMRGQSITFYLKLDRGPMRRYSAPLNANGKMGEYGFDLGVLRPFGTRLLGLGLGPATRPVHGGSNRIQIGDMRLRRVANSKPCS